MPVTITSATGGLNPLWAKAPLMFLRFPGLLGAVAIGTLLLTLAAGASYLYLSAVAGGIVREVISSPSTTRYGAGMSYRSTNVGLNQRAPGSDDLLLQRRGEEFAKRARQSPLLGSTVMGIAGPEVAISAIDDPSENRRGKVFARTDALSHVTVIAGSEGPGVWISDLVANGLDLSPGDSITLRHEGRTADVAIDGVYRGLYAEPRSSHGGYWLSWVDQIHKGDPLCDRCPIPATFVIADADQALELTKRLGEDSATFGWDAPAVERDLSIDDVRDLASFVDEFETAITQSRSDLGQLFDCCGRGFRPQSRFPFTETRFTSSVPEVVARAEERLSLVQGPVQLLLVAGLLVGGTVVAAGGAFALARRRAETTFLYARGVSPGSVAAKAALESILPCAAGAIAGLLLAIGLVEAFGPDGVIARSARSEAIVAAVVAVPVSIVLVGIVSALWFQRGRSRSSRRVIAWRVPVELVLIVAAFFLLRRLQRTGAFLEGEGATAARPSVNLLLFPVLFTAGFGALGARLLTGTFQAARAHSARWPTWLYLALHRLAGVRVLSILLIAAATLCLGIFVNAQTVIQSLEKTVDAKAKLFVGSDMQARVNPSFSSPKDFPMPITKVTRLPRAGTFEPGGATFDLLAVDPDTLTSAAYWDPSFADVPLEEVANELTDPRGRRVPAVVVARGELEALTTLSIRGEDIPVQVVARADAFPGMISKRPLVVMPADVFTSFFGLANPLGTANASTELWVKGNASKAAAALAALEPAPYILLTVDDVKDVPSIEAVLNTFGVLNVLAIGAGLLVFVVLLMYVQTRQRAQTVAYGLSRRMGLKHAGYRRSLIAEIASILATSAAMGAVLAVISAGLINSEVDPLATIPPDPLFAAPWALVTVTLIAALLISWPAGALIGHRVRRARLAEAVRVAE